MHQCAKNQELIEKKRKSNGNVNTKVGNPNTCGYCSPQNIPLTTVVAW